MAGHQRTVYWKTLQGRTLPVVFDDATTMGDLRTQVQAALSVPSREDVHLIVYGREPEDATLYASFKPETMGIGGHIVIRSAAATAAVAAAASPETSAAS